MAVLLQTRLEIVGIEFQMRGIARSHCLEIAEILYSMYHITMKPQEDGKQERQGYPYGSPGASLTDGHLVSLLVDYKHVKQKDCGDENHKTS